MPKSSRSKIPIYGQQFAAEFSCIGSACEDDCCHGWDIFVEKKAFKGLKKLYPNPSKLAPGEVVLKRSSNPASEWDYGVLDTHKRCGFLRADGLCDVHARFGGDKLGWVCRDFPRSLFKNGEQYELQLTFGCPEVVRCCLRNEGGAEIVQLSSETQGQLSGFLKKMPQADYANPYGALSHDIRGILYLFFGAEQYSVNDRLYLLLSFAFRVAPFFFKDTDCFDLHKLSQVLDQLSDPVVHADLVSGFRDTDFDAAPSISVIHAMLSFRSKNTSDFARFVEHILTSHVEVDSGQVDRLSRDDLAELIRVYFDRRMAVESAHAEVLEFFIFKYVEHYLFNKPYTDSPSLVAYLRTLLVQINIVKFLFLLNPSLEPVLKGALEDGVGETTRSVLEKAFVQACYQSARAFEHVNGKMLEVASQSLEAQGFDTLEKLTQLAKA